MSKYIEDKGQVRRAARYAYDKIQEQIDKADYQEQIKQFLLDSLAHEEREALGLNQSLKANLDNDPFDYEDESEADQKADHDNDLANAENGINEF